MTGLKSDIPEHLMTAVRAWKMVTSFSTNIHTAFIYYGLGAENVFQEKLLIVVSSCDQKNLKILYGLQIVFIYYITVSESWYVDMSLKKFL